MAGTEASSSNSDYDSAGSDYEGAPSASDREEQHPQSHASVTEAPQADLGTGDTAAMDATVPDEAQSSDNTGDLLQRADELKVEGNRLYGEGKFTEAAAKYNEAIATG